MKIAVYNPLSGHGHLDSWNAIVVQALVERGHSVLAITQNPTALWDLLDVRGFGGHSRLRVVPIAKPRKRPLGQRIGRFFVRSARDVVGLLTNIVRGQPAYPLLRKREGFFLDPGGIATNVSAACDQDNVPDIVLVMYMDLYRRERLAWRAYDKALKVPWAGIRFHVAPSDERPQEEWFRSQAFRGLGFLDEDICNQHARWFPERHFVCLPEITTHVACPEHSGLVTSLKTRAQGRKIVFYGGSLGRSKNLAMWGRVMAAMDPKEWFFCLVGEICTHDLLPEDRAVVEALQREPRENVLSHLQYIGVDCVFNALVASSDVVYAVYRDFPYSSNIITKSAWLEKPVVVSERYAMGQRVRRYGFGLTTPEDDRDAIVQSLERACAMTVPKEAFASCQAECNEAVLGDRLEAWLHRCVGGAKSR